MIYADYAATTPVSTEVMEAMLPYYAEHFFNPSSIYSGGREAAAALNRARSQIAAYIGAEEDEIIFTGGGTESDNLAIKGAALGLNCGKRHIITSVIEHHGVLSPCKWLERNGFTVTYLPVGHYGTVEPEVLRKAMTPNTCLVSIMWANNETGALQDIKSLADIAHGSGAWFHTDAVQAVMTQKVDVRELGVDLLSLSAHKIYGPKGCGILYCKREVPLEAVNQGGQQENGRRGGTENVPSAIGMAKAMEMLEQSRRVDVHNMRKYKEFILNEFKDCSSVRNNSPLDITVPSICNLGFRGMEAEGILFYLNQKEIFLSMGAACNTKSIEPSYVLKAMKVEEEYLRGCIRISLSGKMNMEEIKELVKELKRVLKKYSQ